MLSAFYLLAPHYPKGIWCELAITFVLEEFFVVLFAVYRVMKVVQLYFHNWVRPSPTLQRKIVVIRLMWRVSYRLSSHTSRYLGLHPNASCRWQFHVVKAEIELNWIQCPTHSRNPWFSVNAERRRCRVRNDMSCPPWKTSMHVEWEKAKRSLIPHIDCINTTAEDFFFGFD